MLAIEFKMVSQNINRVLVDFWKFQKSEDSEKNADHSTRGQVLSSIIVQLLENRFKMHF